MPFKIFSFGLLCNESKYTMIFRELSSERSSELHNLLVRTTQSNPALSFVLLTCCILLINPCVNVLSQNRMS